VSDDQAHLKINTKTQTDPFTAWDYELSGELGTIRKDLFKTLIFNKDLLAMSSKILSSPQLKDGFIGVHLRIEKDWPAILGDPVDQIRLYIEEMEKIPRASTTDHRTVYVSCGNRTRIEPFRQLLAPLGYTVYDKWSLYQDDPVALQKIEGLRFDEKAIIEYEMLVKADFFLGLLMSTMSSLVAFARTVDDTELFFPTYVFPGSIREGRKRKYLDAPSMKGDDKTKLMTVKIGKDVMPFFP